MPTRTLFYHISTAGQAIFYCLALIAVAVCFSGFFQRYRLWLQGRPSQPSNWRARLGEMADQVFAQRRVRRRRYGGSLHVLIFFGMLALFVGTNIVGIEHYGSYLFGNHWLYRGWFYLLCKLSLDLFGLALAAGTIMALARRHSRTPPNLGLSWKDDGFLVLLLAATLTGFLLEGAGIAADPTRAPYADWSPVGGLFAHALGPIGPAGYIAAWWIHMPLVLGLIAALPYGRWLHLFVIPATIALAPERPMGALLPVSVEEVEQTGVVGLDSISALDRWQLMSLDGCMECGRCTDACPAHAVGKELNPKQIVIDLRRLMGQPKQPDASEKDSNVGGGNPAPMEAGAASTDMISDESLWACTNCHACVRECPALIRHVDIIDGIRRYRVAEGRLSGNAATMLRQLGSRENPWGLPASQRLDWAQGLDVAQAAKDDGREVLLWVGCAGAFEPRAQKTVRALTRLLQRAGVRFTVLGPRERCCGDPARRVGDEFLYQQLAEANIGTLTGIGAKTIVTHCPHCLHTVKNEYPQMGGDFEVLHHTQFLEQLVAQGRLNLDSKTAGSVTYHDPCFLARVNGETKAPRALLAGGLQEPILEPARRESRTFCCGAGGGRMWMEEPPNKRPGVNRSEELIATGARTVAVSCPFCRVMLDDSLKQVAGEAAPAVVDVAEVMLSALASTEVAAS